VNAKKGNVDHAYVRV